MKPNASTTIIRGDMTGERVEMGIDAENMKHIVRILTDIYADPELAVIREYSTNAFDAHRDAGHTRPIQITKPTDWNPMFTIRDFGTGLSKDDIRNIYSSYGRSTKQNSNDVVGMLGIGCKSGLTYTSQVQITSFIDGQRIESLMTRDEDGAPVISILSSVPTDEPNGVQISIAVSNSHTFNQKISSFFKYWNPSDVLIDGEPPVPVDLDHVVDEIYISSAANHHVVVMGNVPYRVSEGLDVKMPQGKYLVAKVDIGEVDFPPSREELYYSPTTKNKLQSIADRYQKNIDQKAEQEITQSKTAFDAMVAIEKWSAFSSVDTWGNLPPLTTVRGGGMFTWHVGHVSQWGRSRNTVQSHYNVGYNAWRKLASQGKLAQVVDFDLSSFSSSHRAKFEQLLKNKGIDFNALEKVVINDVDKFDGWLDAMTFSMNDIRKVKLPKSSGGTLVTRTQGRYDIWQGPTDRWKLGHPDPSKPIVYWSSAQLYSTSWLAEAMTRWPDVQWVTLTRNRWEKFLRECPNAIELHPFMKGECQKAFDKLTGNEQAYIVGSLQVFGKGAWADAVSKFDDPLLRKMILFARKMNNRDNHSVEYREYQETLAFYRGNIPEYSFEPTGNKSNGREALDIYPTLPYSDMDERVRVYNAIHFYEQNHPVTEPASNDAEKDKQ